MDAKRKKKLIKEVQSIVGREWVFHSAPHLQVYGYDASLDQVLPDLIALPENAGQIAAIIRLARRERIPFLPRGAGTNLTGGSIPRRAGIVIGLSRLKAISSIDLNNLRAEVEVGVTNLEFQNAVGPLGYLYAPDPASQKVSTIGGNVGENSGGPHCLKYGVTTNHILGLEAVMPDGNIIQFGGQCLDSPGYDLVGLLVGSEGTLGIATRATLRILHQPQAIHTVLAIFDSLEDAGKTVSAIIAAGIIPAALEMIDRVVLGAVEASVHAGYPLDAAGVLIIELDGIQDGLERQAERIRQICQENHVREVRVAKDAAERDILWKGRRGAFGAVARVKTSYLCADGTVPRTELPRVLRQVGKIGQKYNLTIGNVFHAGDGNLHPLILFDDREEGERARVIQAGKEILEACVLAGGTISGEHGIGLEKIDSMSLIFSPEDLSWMRKVKKALDPSGLCNPDKIFPPEEPSPQSPPKPAESFRSEDFPGSLSRIVGQEHLRQDAIDVKQSAVDGKVPTAVVFPGSAQESGEVLRLATEKNFSVIPRGCGTKMAFGHAPARADVVLALSRMGRVLEADRDNLTLTVEAGAKLQDLQERLAKQRCFIPLDPPFPAATIGGILATNSSGPKRLLYGSARDITLGLKVVLPGGDIVKAGGKTVKNVSGYDLTKLYIGSFGTLGIISEATLRLLPIPDKEVILIFPCQDPLPAGRLASQILHSDLVPSSLLLCTRQAAAVLPHAPSASSPDEVFLLVGLEGLSEAVESQTRMICGLSKGEGLDDFQILQDSAAKETWEAIRDIYNRLPSPPAVSCKVSTLISNVVNFFKKAQSMAAMNYFDLALIANLGAGISNILLWPQEQKEAQEVLGLSGAIAALRQEAEDAGGHLLIEWASPALKESVSVWGRPGPSFPYMKAIKAVLDPRNILNPGRFYGGL